MCGMHIEVLANCLCFLEISMTAVMETSRSASFPNPSYTELELVQPLIRSVSDFRVYQDWG